MGGGGEMGKKNDRRFCFASRLGAADKVRARGEVDGYPVGDGGWGRKAGEDGEERWQEFCFASLARAAGRGETVHCGRKGFVKVWTRKARGGGDREEQRHEFCFASLEGGAVN